MRKSFLPRLNAAIANLLFVDDFSVGDSVFVRRTLFGHPYAGQRGVVERVQRHERTAETCYVRLESGTLFPFAAQVLKRI